MRAMASAVSGVAEAGLSTTRAAGGQGRGDLARDHRRREVPGRHRGDRPDRLAQHPVPLARLWRRNPLAAHPPRLLGEPAEVAERKLDFLLRFLERLAVLERHEPGELVAPLLHELLDLEEDAPAILGRQRRPLAKRGLRGRDRALDLGRAAVGDLARRRSASAGFLTSKVAPPSASTHSPLMYMRSTSAMRGLLRVDGLGVLPPRRGESLRLRPTPR